MPRVTHQGLWEEASLGVWSCVGWHSDPAGHARSSRDTWRLWGDQVQGHKGCVPSVLWAPTCGQMPLPLETQDERGWPALQGMPQASSHI